MASPRLVDLSRKFIAEGAQHGWSLATRQAYGGALEAFFRFLADRGVRQLDQLQPGPVADWILFVRTRRLPPRRRREQAGCAGYAAYTILAYLAVCRRFCGWLVRRRLLLVDPWEGLPRLGLRADPVAGRQIPSESQMHALLACLPHGDDALSLRDRAMVELIYSCGLRTGEVRRLTLGDLDVHGKRVRVRLSKGRKDRVVPVGQPALDAVLRWLDDGRPEVASNPAEQALFLTLEGRPLGIATFRARLKKFRDRCGLERLRVHDLRHASALHMIRRGADIRAVQEFLGHSNITTTQIYTRLVPEDIKAAHQKAHPRERHKDRG